LSARTAGRLTIKREGDSSQKTVDLQAGRARREYLRHGRYEFIMYYGAGVEPESKKQMVESGSRTAVAFQNVAVKPKPVSTAYDYKKNADRLFKRATEALSHQRTIPEMAYYDELSFAGRKLFVVHGAHFNPKHIRAMENVFEKENIAENAGTWLFLVDGI
jgi:hypothetical protein